MQHMCAKCLGRVLYPSNQNELRILAIHCAKTTKNHIAHPVIHFYLPQSETSNRPVEFHSGGDKIRGPMPDSYKSVKSAA